ncbi:MAG: GGDEF domain-containing protein [Dyella sp.]
MKTKMAVYEANATITLVTKVYARALLVGFALIPAALIVYLLLYQDSTLTFENHAFHILVIGLAILEGIFIAYVSWCCYRSSRDPLLRWLTLGFVGFTLIYMLHGAFTGLANHNIWLFLLYGPTSRLTMAVLLLIGLLSYHRPADPIDQGLSRQIWLRWITLFVALDVAVACLAYTALAGRPVVWAIEGSALFFSGLNLVLLLLRRIRSPMMVIYGISVAWFALASIAFMLALPWNHMWWLAHIIFAAGFFVLSYGVVDAFRTTRSFSTIYSREELMSNLTGAIARSELAAQELQRINEKLEYQAATDSLTGVGNRREFLGRVEAEVARTRRGGSTFSLLSLDIDYFKMINDTYGHQGGDNVLRGFVQKCLGAIRPYDWVARVGGEEFMVLLPQTRLQAARVIGERIRSDVESCLISTGHGKVTRITVSIGVVEFGVEGNTLDAILRVADQRLYRAKHHGRNCVVSA